MRPMAFKTNTRMDAVTGNEFYGIAIDSYSNNYMYKVVMDKQIQVVYLGLQVTLIYGGVQLT